MVWSMTGYGEGSAPLGDASLKITLRCVNARFLDLNLRLPADWQRFSQQVESTLKGTLCRGRVDLTLRVEGMAAKELRVDRGALQSLWAAVASMHEDAPERKAMPAADVLFTALLPQLGHVVQTEVVLEESASAEALEIALAAALRSLVENLRAEGGTLQADLLARCHTLREATATMEGLAREALPQLRQRFREQLATWLSEDAAAAQPGRLEQELVSFAARSDVTEELVRLASHLDQLEQLLNSGGAASLTDEEHNAKRDARSGSPSTEQRPRAQRVLRQPGIGRKLDFLVQEMHREANTIGSKSSTTALSHAVVDAKAEIEKIREQVQNLA